MAAAEFVDNYYAVTANVETGKAVWDNNIIAAMNPFRFYMAVTSREEENMPISKIKSMGIAVRGEELPDGTTLIYDVEAEVIEDMIFDLQGRRVLETETSGIYIKGGKKVLVK